MRRSSLLQAAAHYDLIARGVPPRGGRPRSAAASSCRVNHRNLTTFRSQSLTAIAPSLPPGTVLVAESGIRTADDVRLLGAVGAHAVLVGEHLMRAPSPGQALRELLAW